MSKPVFILIEDDFQEVARERIHRDLTEDELQSAVHYFQNGNQWWESAKAAVDLAVDDHKSAS